MRNNKTKMVIDTNVFVNSMIFPYEYTDDTDTLDLLLTLIGNDKIELVFSQDTIGELLYIMKNKIKHYINKEKHLSYMNKLMTIFYYSYSVNTENTNAPKCQDAKDDMFLKCVIQSHASYLISNDFKSGMSVVQGLNCKVLSSNQFVELYNNNQLEDIAVEQDDDK
jgi:putative PIN family toxin of toxin-antitoxin system